MDGKICDTPKPFYFNEKHLTVIRTENQEAWSGIKTIKLVLTRFQK